MSQGVDPAGGNGGYRPRFLYGGPQGPAPAQWQAPQAPQWQPQWQPQAQPQWQPPAPPQWQPQAQPQWQAPAQPQAPGGYPYQAPAAPYQAPAAPAYQPNGNGTAFALSSAMQVGLAADWVAAPHVRALERRLATATAEELNQLVQLVNAGATNAERVFILKAYAAKEPIAAVAQYAAEMRGMAESEIVRRSTMRDVRELVQQWQDACGPAMLQAMAGEADPRYAWELNKSQDLGAVDANMNASIAQQQAAWLQQYGGVAVPRGATGGQGIAITDLLNTVMGGISGATYAPVDVKPNPQAGLEQTAQALASGYDVPIRVSWDAGPGDGSGHFMLAMAVRGQGGNRQFQIHDPWTGSTAWVAEASILANNFSPLANGFARFTHMYQPSPSA